MDRTTPLIGRITRPVLAGSLPRRHLFRQIDAGRRKSVVWIAGPPGSGKTTLVSGYVDARKIPCIWYQAGRSDADPAAFFHYLAIAAGRITPVKRIPLPGAGPEGQPLDPRFAERFFDALFCRLPKGTALVIDDFHRIPADSPLHNAIREGLSRLQPSLSVILISRGRPPGPYSRLRAEGRMEVVGWGDLRLTPKEGRAIARLNGHGGKGARVIDGLIGKADGWVAGLILLLLVPAVATAALAVPRRDAENLGEIVSYLAVEVFESLEEEEKDFLLKSAFLPRMTGAMAARLSGNARSPRILERLYQDGHFTEMYPGADPVYEYHSLFRAFLLSVCKDRFPPEEIARLRRNAAAILEDSGQVEDAATLYGTAGDVAGLSRLVRANARSLTEKGRGKTVEIWIGLLPEKVRGDDPWLLYWTGVSLLRREPGRSIVFFERAFRKFEEMGEEEEALRSWAGAVDAILLEGDHFDLLDPWIDRLERRLVRDPSFPSPRLEARVSAGMAAALSWRRPGDPRVGEWAERALALRRHKLNPSLSSQTILNASNNALWRGDWGKCDVLLDELRHTVRPRDTYTPILLGARWLEGACRIWSGESPEGGLEAVGEGLGLADRTGVRLLDGPLLGLATHACLLMGDEKQARRHLERLTATLTPQSRSGSARYHYLAAWLHLSRNENLPALKHAETARALVREGGGVFPGILARIGYAQLLHETGDRAIARRELEEALAHARSTGSALLEFEALLALSGCRLDEGDEPAGLSALREALALGRERNFRGHAGWWRPKRMSRLCAKALEAGIEPGYARELIRRRGLMPDAPLVEAEEWPWAIRVYTFGRFTLVRDGLPHGASRKSPQKVLLMLKALIALGGRNVSVESITERLWPETDGDLAHESFAVTLRRLRHLLGTDEAVILTEGRLTLNNRICWVDTWALERILGRIDRLGGETDTPGIGAECSRLAEKAIGLYKGPFLDGETLCPCIDSHRERLRSKFLRCLSVAGGHWERAGEWGRAVACYQKGLEIDALAEEFCQRLIYCYKRMGRQSDACALFHRCRKTLKEVLGVPPSTETIALMKTPAAE